jgi:phosphatidylserine/phosphatidylglycerophosphate/cardiolipin synthase-like enzyme
MADLNFILQAVTTANHAESIRTLLALSKPTQIVVSVAFARTTGLESIQKSIKPLADKTKFFVGIRNDITSIQAIKKLLALKVDLYAVDTGSRKVIFHPKLYLAVNASSAIAIVGSANMTFGGLHNNIEVSTRMVLDFKKILPTRRMLIRLRKRSTRCLQIIRSTFSKSRMRNMQPSSSRKDVWLTRHLSSHLCQVAASRRVAGTISPQ